MSDNANSRSPFTGLIVWFTTVLCIITFKNIKHIEESKRDLEDYNRQQESEIKSRLKKAILYPSGDTKFDTNIVTDNEFAELQDFGLRAMLYLNNRFAGFYKDKENNHEVLFSNAMTEYLAVKSSPEHLAPEILADYIRKEKSFDDFKADVEEVIAKQKEIYDQRQLENAGKSDQLSR